MEKTEKTHQVVAAPPGWMFAEYSTLIDTLQHDQDITIKDFDEVMAFAVRSTGSLVPIAPWRPWPPEDGGNPFYLTPLGRIESPLVGGWPDLYELNQYLKAELAKEKAA
jgi:hypothetical protein